VTRRIAPALGIVQEATGTVVGIEFDDQERTPWVGDADHAAWARGWVNLEHLPTCVFVKLDGEDGKEECKTRFVDGEEPGVFAITAEEDDSDEIHIDGYKIRFKRKQIPLAPRDVRTVQSMQGVTATYLVANLAGGENLATEEASLEK